MISVVIPSHNRAGKLRILLESLSKQTYRDFEIVVVSDSEDGTEELVKEFARTSKIKTRFFRKKSDGPAHKRNVGARAANGKFIAFIDDDCEADKNWLRNIAKTFKSGAGAVEGRTVTDKRITPFSHYILNESGGQYMTCNMAFRKDVMQKLGGFDERFTTPVTINREDSDLAFSLLDSGGRIDFAKDAVVKHPVAKMSFLNRLRKKKEFFLDPLLYKKHKKLYIERIRFPFEMFTPFYILAILAAVLVNPLFLALLFLIARAEAHHRKWSAGPVDIIKLTILQVIGSFVIVVFYLYGCLVFRVNPLGPVIHR